MPELVVDALLGQGEAPFCFNLKLQNEWVKSAQLSNQASMQQIEMTEQDIKIKNAYPFVSPMIQKLVDSE
jgi:hypothetical protein